MRVIGNLNNREKKEVRKLTNKYLRDMSKYEDKIKILTAKTHRKKGTFLKLRNIDVDEPVIGLNSNSFTSSPNKHILMLDVDLKKGITIEMVERACIKTQKKFDLPSIHLYKSSLKGLFVLCFTELTLDELMKIISEFKYEDIKHLKYLLKNKYLTLRTDKKKEKKSSKVKYYKTIYNISKTRKELLGAKAVFDKIIGEKR